MFPADPYQRMTPNTHVRLTNLTRSFHEGEQLHAVLKYPGAWQVNLLHLDLQLDVQAVIDDQELNATVRYWEGAVNVSGKRNGRKLGGRGCVELTGSAGIAEPE
jgi:predicted secreted hydrolase